MGQLLLLVNWGYSHPIRRCLYGTLTRTNDPWLASSPNKHNCITDHKILPKSTIPINMLPTPSAADNSYDLLLKSSLLPSSLPTTLLYITWLSAHILTHSSESLVPEIKYYYIILPFTGFYITPRPLIYSSSLDFKQILPKLWRVGSVGRNLLHLVFRQTLQVEWPKTFESIHEDILDAQKPHRSR